MQVIIGSARGDEHGGIKGGQAGDQTGKEVCTQNFYVGSQAWRCFRPKDPEVAKKIAYDMKAACTNNYIGYDQSNNQSLLHVVAKYNYDCAKVKEYCETDCSSLIRVCILYAGINIGIFDTGDEPQYLLATGAFTEMKGSQYTVTGTGLQVGDILVTAKKGHTVAVVEVIKPKKVTEDGYWGKDTTKATQEMYGTVIDGIVSKQYRLNKKYLPNATSGWEWVLLTGKGSPMVRLLQKEIGAKVDGVLGKNSIKQLQQFLKSKGLYTGTIDGVMKSQTVIAWQKYINRRFS